MATRLLQAANAPSRMSPTSRPQWDEPIRCWGQIRFGQVAVSRPIRGESRGPLRLRSWETSEMTLGRSGRRPETEGSVTHSVELIRAPSASERDRAQTGCPRRPRAGARRSNQVRFCGRYHLLLRRSASRRFCHGGCRFSLAPHRGMLRECHDPQVPENICALSQTERSRPTSPLDR